jgi:hypothetical protein
MRWHWHTKAPELEAVAKRPFELATGRHVAVELHDFSIVEDNIPSPTNLTKTNAKDKSTFPPPRRCKKKATPTPVIPKFILEKSLLERRLQRFHHHLRLRPLEHHG